MSSLCWDGMGWDGWVGRGSREERVGMREWSGVCGFTVEVWETHKRSFCKLGRHMILMCGCVVSLQGEVPDVVT